MTDTYELWVCVGCYFAHHYGATPTVTGTDHLAPQPINHDDVARYLAEGWTVNWYAGESDTPCDREPLNECEGMDLFDNTCSNHEVEDLYDADGMHTHGDTTACPHCHQTGWEDGIEGFSMNRCDGCGSRLGGNRYRLKGVAR